MRHYIKVCRIIYLYKFFKKNLMKKIYRKICLGFLVCFTLMLSVPRMTTAQTFDVTITAVNGVGGGV